MLLHQTQQILERRAVELERRGTPSERAEAKRGPRVVLGWIDHQAQEELV